MIKEAGIEYALLFLTETGLKKALLDATQPLRTLLSSKDIHDYYSQGQGGDCKVVLQAVYLDGQDQHEVKTSLYRPQTKNGDPRIWFSRLGKLAAPGEVLALFCIGRGLYFINLSGLGRDKSREAAEQFFEEARDTNTSVARELLTMFREIAAAGPIEAVCEGPTAVGRSIETALGIQINSSREPDYRGIEIKSSRVPLAGRGTRQTLFACVPDWSLSNCRSSAEILDNYGYQREEDFRLYCTVSTLRPNTQSLQLEFITVSQALHETAVNPIREVAIWPLSRLHGRLAKKHKETFWVKARSETIHGAEHFHLESVTHTRNPSLVQFDTLLADGIITLDHLIKRKSGRVSEKGPLFKIRREHLADLFLSDPVLYQLA
jgi:hypothetical protein